MQDRTHGIEAAQEADRQAVASLIEIAYDELRRLAAAKLANEQPGHTLDATALVHEVFLKLMHTPSAFVAADGHASRSQFLRAAAVAMQRILVDHARKKRAEKRGGDRQRFEVSEADLAFIPDPDTVIAVNEALESLAAEDTDAAEVARLRLFAGLTIDEAAEGLGVSRATAFRDWAYARAWLTAALSE